MTSNQHRSDFREAVFSRDNHICIVPWCDEDAVDAHHIIERALWSDGGYIPDNGASVCEKHHKYAESNSIPPQAFYMWAGIETPPLPESIDTIHVNKWGEPFEIPPHQDLRERIKYQSTRHLLPLYWYDDTTVAQERMEHDDTGVEEMDEFVDVPLVITEKVDGGNCMLVSDIDNPVRARNGSRPEDTMKPLYKDGGLYWEQEVHQKLPDRLQVFGEWVYAKHSIHYGCECEPECEDVGPYLSEMTGVNDKRAYFQVFGVFDKQLNIWLSWKETEEVADVLGFPTVPVLYVEDDTDTDTFTTAAEARNTLIEMAHKVIDKGGEGIVVRSKFPFHYGQFPQKVGKYVRENHVKDDALHWSKRKEIQNRIAPDTQLYEL